MDNLSVNKLDLFKKFGLQVNVTKADDILKNPDVKIKDVLASDKQINKMTDIFPRSENQENDFWG